MLNTDKIKCSIRGCKDPARARGLCRPHYYYFYFKIKQGEVEGGWEALEKKGLTKKVERGGKSKNMLAILQEAGIKINRKKKQHKNE